MLTRYLIENLKFKKPVVVAYNEHGVIAFYDGTELDKLQSEWFVKHLPVLESMIPQYRKDHTFLRVNKATIDTSFEAAYNAYNYKVGKKEKARKLWDALPEGDRQWFFRMLPDYNAYLSKTKVAKAYFETFLNNHYWKNDFKSQLF